MALVLWRKLLMAMWYGFPSSPMCIVILMIYTGSLISISLIYGQIHVIDGGIFPNLRCESGPYWNC